MKLKHEKLIEKINALGPWTHGYFDLGKGLIIEDQDILQKKRLLAYKDYFIDIIANYYKKSSLPDKTLCDIGCNSGYFLYELFKRFHFKHATGLEPRNSNLAKARFIAKYFKLPADTYRLKKFDVLTKTHRLPAYDIVLLPGVLHHLDNHFHALSNVFKMTRELCIFDTLVLPNELNTAEIAERLELKDEIYKKITGCFGIIGYKLETDKLDGSAFHTGMVGYPTEEVLLMMLRHVGFTDIKVYRNSKQLKKEVYYDKSYREVNAIIVVASKKKNKQKQIPCFNKILRNIHKEEFHTFVPMDIIQPVYKHIAGDCSEGELPQLSYWVYESAFYHNKERGEKATVKLQEKIGNQNYYAIIKTFKHAPQHKIMFEYAKTCYHGKLLEKSGYVANELIKIVNLDWRTVYKTYHLLALINFKKGNNAKAAKYNNIALRAFDSYFPALELKRSLEL